MQGTWQRDYMFAMQRDGPTSATIYTPAPLERGVRHIRQPAFVYETATDVHVVGYQVRDWFTNDRLERDEYWPDTFKLPRDGGRRAAKWCDDVAIPGCIPARWVQRPSDPALDRPTEHTEGERINRRR